MFNELPWKGFSWIQNLSYSNYILQISHTCQTLSSLEGIKLTSKYTDCFWSCIAETIKLSEPCWCKFQCQKQPSRGSKSLVGPSWHFAKSVPGQASGGRICRKPVNSQDHPWSLLQNHDDFRTLSLACHCKELRESREQPWHKRLEIPTSSVSLSKVDTLGRPRDVGTVKGSSMALMMRHGVRT